MITVTKIKVGDKTVVKIQLDSCYPEGGYKVNLAKFGVKVYTAYLIPDYLGGFCFGFYKQPRLTVTRNGEEVQTGTDLSEVTLCIYPENHLLSNCLSMVEKALRRQQAKGTDMQNGLGYCPFVVGSGVLGLSAECNNGCELWDNEKKCCTFTSIAMSLDAIKRMTAKSREDSHGDADK